MKSICDSIISTILPTFTTYKLTEFYFNYSDYRWYFIEAYWLVLFQGLTFLMNNGNIIVGYLLKETYGPILDCFSIENQSLPSCDFELNKNKYA